jgi:hypothetical protein
MNGNENVPEPGLEHKLAPPADKTGWKVVEGANKCLAKPSIPVTAEMEKRRVEVSRAHVAGLNCVTYYDPLTEVYWSEKSDVE